MTRRLGRWMAATRWPLLGCVARSRAPAPDADARPRAAAEKKEEEKPKTYWEEHKLFAYIENSYTFNLTGAGRGGTNELRFYDYDEGYTFNVAEFSIKKDPSEKYWWGYGLVVTARHRLAEEPLAGDLPRQDDTFPFRNTTKFDLQEAYLSAMLPIGERADAQGRQVRDAAGVRGDRVAEQPELLAGLSVHLRHPADHTGGLLSYTFSEQFDVTAGVVLGWDNSRNNNDAVCFTGQFATTPIKDLTANLNWIVGPEQNDNDDQSAGGAGPGGELHGVQEHDAGVERRLWVRAG